MPPDGALQGSAQNGDLWALGGLPKVGEDFKLVLRVTGTGELSVVAVGPDSSRQEPNEVQEHSASNFQRPGDEWGTWWRFDRAGCWRIVIDRGELRGVITLLVSP